MLCFWKWCKSKNITEVFALIPNDSEFDELPTVLFASGVECLIWVLKEMASRH